MPLKAVEILLIMRLQVVDHLSRRYPSLSSPPTSQPNKQSTQILASEYEEYGSDADAETSQASLNELLANVETFGSLATSGILPGDVISVRNVG